mmetsp:Transcript_9003/g.27612  ORF Transcript_9003/g.27612 Transcript_9003/m.27612 type:complete len:728 (+) Transcript_9003:476-2659(+)
MNDGLEDVFCHRHRCQGKALPPAGTRVRFKLHLSSKSLCWQSGFVCWEGSPSSSCSGGRGDDTFVETVKASSSAAHPQQQQQQRGTRRSHHRSWSGDDSFDYDDDNNDYGDGGTYGSPFEEYRSYPAELSPAEEDDPEVVASVETWAASVMGILDGNKDRNYCSATDRALLHGAGILEEDDDDRAAPSTPKVEQPPGGFHHHHHHQVSSSSSLRLGIASPLLGESSGPFSTTPSNSTTRCHGGSPLSLLNADVYQRPPSAPARAMMLASPRVVSPRTPPPLQSTTPRSEPPPATDTLSAGSYYAGGAAPNKVLEEHHDDSSDSSDRISLRVVSVDEPKLPWLATAVLPPSRAASIEELEAHLAAAVEAGNASAIQKLKRRRETRKRAKRGDHCRVEVRLEGGRWWWGDGGASSRSDDAHWSPDQQQQQKRGPFGSHATATPPPPQGRSQKVRIDAYAVNAAGAGAALRAMLDANAAALRALRKERGSSSPSESSDREEMFRNLGWAELVEQLKIILSRCEPEGICCNHLSRAFEKEFGSALVETLFGDFESLAALLRAPQLQHVVRLSESPGKPDLAVFLATTRPYDASPHGLWADAPPPVPHLLTTDDQRRPTPSSFTFSPPGHPRYPTVDSPFSTQLSPSALSNGFRDSPLANFGVDGPRLPTDFFRPISAASPGASLVDDARVHPRSARDVHVLKPNKELDLSGLHDGVSGLSIHDAGLNGGLF